MGSSVLTIRNLASYDHLISKATTIQCVRWKRKPIWLPTAKSKLFRIPKKPVIPEIEARELQNLHNNYRTAMKSLRSFFAQKYKEQENKNIDEVSQDIIEEDYLVRYHINKEWNKQVAAEREERLLIERRNRAEEIEEKVKAKKQRDLMIQLEIDAKIRQAKQDSQTFITSENVDEAVRMALKTIVNHNAAIDLEGNYYVERKEEVEN